MINNDPQVKAVLDQLDTQLPPFENGWANVLSRASADPAPQRFASKLKVLSGRHRKSLATSIGLAAAVVVLSFAGPWRGGLSLVDRAAAAITPTKDTILHLITTESDSGTDIRTESWQLGDPVQAVRITRSGQGVRQDWSMKITRVATASDGSTSLRGATVAFCPADNTLRTTEDSLSKVAGAAPVGALPGAPDPVSQLQGALDSGLIHEDGHANLGGQDVLRLVGRTLGTPDVSLGVTYYVNAQSLIPVRLEWTGAEQASSSVTTGAIDFAAVDRLPATTENLPLLDAAAQHPGSPAQSALEATNSCG